MSCNRTLQIQSYLDGELTAPDAAAAERHLETCPDCAALKAEIETIRRAMRALPYHRTDPAFRTRLTAALDREAGARRTGTGRLFRARIAGGVAAVAMAAALAVYALMPSAQDAIAGDVVAAYLHALTGPRLVEVASGNRRTVEPWLDGHVDLSPPVADFAAQGFRLVGGRVDYVHGERAAVVVYRHGDHVVNVFAWKDNGEARPGLKTRDGYHLYAWRSGGLFLCAVSDVNPAALQKLAALIQGTAKG